MTLQNGMKCTQEDIDMNFVRYVHTGAIGSKQHDNFMFHLWDGNNRSPVMVSYITIKDIEKGNSISDPHINYIYFVVSF